MHELDDTQGRLYDPVPARSLLCKHYQCDKPNHFDTCAQTLQVKVLNRSKNIIAAANGYPLYERKKYSFATQTTSLDGLEQFRQQYQQTARDASTQPYNPILYGSEHTRGEYTMVGKATRYETSEQFLERKLKAVIRIQAMIRQYNAIVHTLKLREAFEQKRLRALAQKQ